MMTDQNTLNNQTTVQESEESIQRRQTRNELRDKLAEKIDAIYDGAMSNADFGSALRAVEDRIQLAGMN
ncbi:hypothetical protein PBI_DEWDROP_54 [Microbacterium phage Dewdrop]|nr:hypothetical protein PBI_LEAF_54 [Microbacterium phage Leaf]QGZ17423.1 hypothetical protein PBI_DEWDROP_54 [Microbacterium phage Dewdrop]